MPKGVNLTHRHRRTHANRHNVSYRRTSLENAYSNFNNMHIHAVCFVLIVVNNDAHRKVNKQLEEAHVYRQARSKTFI